MLPIPRSELEKTLRRHVLDVWYPRCIDEEYGGFLCDFDRRWRSCGPHEKTLEFHGRQTWLAADASIRYPEDASLRRAALHGYEFLAKVAWDEGCGGWFHRLDRSGMPMQNRTKHTHGFAYALLACLAVEEMTGDASALDLARMAFEWLDAHARDPEYGAYFGLMQHDGCRILEPCGAWERELDPIGTPLGCKDVNVNSDLLEAMVRLHTRWPDARLAERMSELVDLLSVDLTGPEGELFYFANADRSPHSGHIRYGHVFQNSYRLLHALARLGEPERGIEEASRGVRYALLHGADLDRGGFFHGNGDLPETPLARSKQWWIQVEGLRALLEVLRVRPHEAVFSEALRSLWQHLCDCLIDERFGGFFRESMDPPRGWRRWLGTRHGDEAMMQKGCEWKYAGHEGQALLLGLRLYDAKAAQEESRSDEGPGRQPKRAEQLRPCDSG